MDMLEDKKVALSKGPSARILQAFAEKNDGILRVCLGDANFERMSETSVLKESHAF